MADININIGDGPSSDGESEREASRVALAMLTSLNGPDEAVGGTLAAEILQDHLREAGTPAEVTQRLVRLALAQIQVAQAAAVAGYVHGRNAALEAGQDASAAPDMDVLLPVLARALTGLGPV